jgi:D-alanyl-D-alanine carboxypeptidase (penicillin-binding protein 5/6)
MSAQIQDSFGPSKRDAGGTLRRSASGKALYALLAFVVLSLFPLLPSARAAMPLHGEDAIASYIVKETGSSVLLKAKEIDRPLSPASLTKIMTCMMAIESGRMNEVVSIPLEATQVEPTRAGFEPGEMVRLRDLVKAAMVNSSNDAAFAIAIHLGGSVDAFVANMNARARAIGMYHTQFTNPAGYDRGLYAGNRTTARDMMILTERAIRYPEFNAIARLDRAVFSELSAGKGYSLRTHNKLMDRYPYTVGIKTGYTATAGPCLIARALKDGKDMLIIMLGARTDRWSLAASMFDQGFGGGPEELQVAVVAPASPRRDTVAAASVVPASRVLAVRSRSQESLKRKSVRESATASVGVIHKGGKRNRSMAKSSINARGQGLKTIRVHGTASHIETVVYKSGKKGDNRKQQLAKARERNLKNRAALKSAKNRDSRKLAIKSGSKQRQVIKIARKGSLKRSTAEVKSDKRRNGKKEALSMSRKPNRSPNG